MNEEYLKELIVGIRVFLWMLSIKIKALSLTEFWKLLEGCSSQQKLYAVWLRYYFRRSDVMKIKEVNTNYILFDNGSRITFDHEQDCCETNYADFEQLEDLALEYEFENDLIFEVVPENGFRLEAKEHRCSLSLAIRIRMVTIPQILIFSTMEGMCSM